MLRFSSFLRASASNAHKRCPYELLGVAYGATEEEVKAAFRVKAKATHPDIAGASGSSAEFKEMVEAYRVLRDPRRRAEYDHKRTQQGQTADRDGPFGNQWPRGDGFGMSEKFRANLYGYDPPKPGDRPPDAYYNPSGLSFEWPILAAVLGGFALYYFFFRPEEMDIRERELYPSSLPAGAQRKDVSLRPADYSDASDPPGDRLVTLPTDAAGKAYIAQQEQLVKAYWNPFHNTWHRIPEGYAAPAAMDLTAWHKQRTDPTQWSRLFAEGKLSEIMPRGGLKQRFRPRWDTFDPVLLMDPRSGKTVQVDDKLPDLSQVAVCEVQF